MPNTPTHGYLKPWPPPDRDDLRYIGRRLGKEVPRRHSRTPSTHLEDDGEVEGSIRHRTERTHRSMKLTMDEIDTHRQEIPYADYWRREAKELCDELSNAIMENLSHEHHREGVHPADAWKEITMALRRKLRRYGLSSQQLHTVRSRIKDDPYWEPELDLFERLGAKREHDFYRQLKRTRGMPSQTPEESFSDLTPAHEALVRTFYERFASATQPIRRSQRLQLLQKRNGGTTPAVAVEANPGKRHHKKQR